MNSKIVVLNLIKRIILVQKEIKKLNIFCRLKQIWVECGRW